MSLEPGDPRLRASDADRDAVVERLREAHAQGRLTVEEFSERLDATYESRTHGELAPITEDLPVPVAGPGTGLERPADEDDDGSLRGAWQVWAAAVLVNVVIWAVVSASSGWVYFWPVWVAGPWGAVLLARTLFGDRRGGGRGGEGPQRLEP